MKNKLWLKILAGVLAAVVLVTATAIITANISGSARDRYDSPAYYVAEETSYAAPQVTYASADSGSGTNSSSGGTTVEVIERKLVRKAELTVTTRTYDDTRAKVLSLLEEAGGYTEELSESGSTTRKLYLTLRIPTEKVDWFLSQLDGVGRVSNRRETVTDMTTRYQDNEARLVTLYAKRDRLNAMLQTSASIRDLIDLESAIADTQYDIDRLETSNRTIDKQVDLTEVKLTVNEEGEAPVKSKTPLGTRIAEGFTDSVRWVGETAENLLVLLITLIPALVPVAVIVGIVVVIVRKKKKAKK